MKVPIDLSITENEDFEFVDVDDDNVLVPMDDDLFEKELQNFERQKTDNDFLKNHFHVEDDYEPNQKIVSEPKIETKKEIIEETREEIKEEIREEIREEIKEEIREEIKEEIKEEINEEIKEESETYLQKKSESEAENPINSLRFRCSHNYVEYVKSDVPYVYTTSIPNKEQMEGESYIKVVFGKDEYTSVKKATIEYLQSLPSNPPKSKFENNSSYIVTTENDTPYCFAY
jgi:uncharacterized protein YbaA (DUF1428 family)